MAISDWWSNFCVWAAACMVGGSPFPIAVTERAAQQIATGLALRWINYPLMQVFTCKDLSLHGKITVCFLPACLPNWLHTSYVGGSERLPFASDTIRPPSPPPHPPKSALSINIPLQLSYMPSLAPSFFSILQRKHFISLCPSKIHYSVQ